MNDKKRVVIEKRLVILFTIVTLIPLCLTSYLFYHFTIKNMESMLGKRLENIAQTGTLLIDPKDHSRVLKHYLASHKQITQTREFKKIKNMLRKIRKKNNLNSDVYTLIKQDWAPGHTLFLVMDNDRHYVGHAAPLNPQVENVFKTGKPEHSLLYQNNKESWVSAFAPIKNKAGKIQAVLQLDYNAKAEIIAVRKQIFYFTTAAILIALLLSIPLGSTIGKSISRPILRLVSGMQKASQGNFSIKIPNNSKWEIGLLTHYFNDTIKEMAGRLNKFEHYTDDLEEKVEFAKTSETQRLLHTILTHTNQGLFVFDKNGKCYPIYSKSCLDLLRHPPGKKYVWEVLEGDEQSFRVWNRKAFQENNFENPPPVFPDRKNKHFSVTYKPIKGTQGHLKLVMAVVEDKTMERQYQAEAKREKNYAKGLLRIGRNKIKYTESLWEITRHIIRMRKLLGLPERNKGDFNLWHRLLYLIKIAAQLYALDDLQKEVDLYVQQLMFLEESPDKYQLVLQRQEKLEREFDRITNQSKNIIGESFPDREYVEIPRSELLSFQEEVKDFELRSLFARKLLFLPISHFFFHYNEIIQNIAQKKGKKIAEIGYIGDDIRVAPEHYKRIFESFVHVFFNIVEYSMEVPSVRRQKNKNETGRIVVKFERIKKEKSDNLYIIVQDDGMGIDPDPIRKNLEKTEKKDDIKKKDDHEIIQYIFNEKLLNKNDSYGTGMDILASETRKIGGNLIIQSALNKKTILIVKVPYISGELSLSEGDYRGKLVSC